ncbi:glycosyltransferase family 2 protein [Methylocaldum sp. MU1018]
MSEYPLITLAVCTHNHADRLRRTLLDLREVKAPRRSIEFLVVDNGSTDETPALLSSEPWSVAGASLRVIDEPNLGVANARNRAIAEARGEYLVFLDDDETPEIDWLIRCENAISMSRPDAFGGRIEVLFEQATRPAWLQDELLGFLGHLDHGYEEKWLQDPSTPIFTGNSGFRVDSIKAVGGFDAGLGRRGAHNFGGEDTDLYKRMVMAGYKVRWIPGAVIHHRIQAWKLSRKYFLDLHYRQGRTEGLIKRGDGPRIPPKYLYPQILRAFWRVARMRATRGSDYSLRLEMNAAYFLGYIQGWFSGRQRG